MLTASQLKGRSVGERSIRVLPGQYYDAETGTHYNYFRDYDPTIGRYSQSDPIGLYGGLNTYLYVAGSPTTNVDPSGRGLLIMNSYKTIVATRCVAAPIILLVGCDQPSTEAAQSTKPMPVMAHTCTLTPTEELRRLAIAADTEAQFCLARRLEKAGEGTANLEEAVTWYSKAAESNHVGALPNLAAIYFDGRGVAPDHARSAALYARAADLGSDGAKVTLGHQFLEGDGVDKRSQEATRLFLEAAEAGYKYAYASLGVVFLRTDGDKSKNLPEAYAWFSVGATAGDEFAKRNVEELSKRMSPEALRAGMARAGQLGDKYAPAIQKRRAGEQINGTT